MADVALTGWMRALIGYVRSGEPDLTNRQMALLMLVYLTPGPHTVRGLARVLGVSKPVVTRALNTLGTLGYLRRERDQDDRRNVFVVRTTTGADFLEGFKRLLRIDIEGAGHRSAIAAQPAQQQSAPAPPSLAAESFALSGPSDPPDPLTHAYRPDLADVALAGRVISSHYAEPLARHLAHDVPLLLSRSEEAPVVAMLRAGDTLHMLDCSLGWAWGYAGEERRVGYVRADALRA